VISTREVLIVLIAEAGALVVAFVLLAGHGVWMAQREQRLAPRREAARAAIVAALVERPDDSLPLAALDGLPRAERLRVLGHADAWVTGRQRAALHDLAERAGLLSRADRYCRSWDWRRRLQGVRIYTMLGGGDHVVSRMFDDRRPEVRAEAALWAAEHPEHTIVERLVSLLGDQATLCRFMVKDSLLRLGATAVDPLCDFLVSAKGPAAAVGLEVAASLRDPRLLDAGLRLVESRDDGLRRRAIELLGALGGERAVEMLVSGLHDQCDEVRAVAARALGSGQHWRTAGDLAAALHDPSWAVRHEAGIALRRLGPSGELLLRRMLADDDESARDMARLMLDLPFVPA
jgi:HEAT repeats